MKKLFLTLISVCAVATVFAQGEVLRLNLKKGDVFNQRLESFGKVKQTLAGQPMEMEIASDTTGELRYEVVGVQDGNYVIEVTYTKLAISMLSPAAGLNVSGNSETPDAGDMLSPMLAGLVNKTFEITMTPVGRIVKVEGMEKLIPEGSPLTDQMKSLRSNMESGMTIFSEEPVSPGESWVAQTSIDNIVNMSTQTKYTLVERTADHILIRAETTMNSDGANTAEFNGMSVKYNFDGTGSSEISLNPKTMWTRSSNGKMKMGGDMTIPAGAQIPSDMEISMAIETTISYTSF